MMRARTLSSFFIVLAVLAMACGEPTPLPPHAVIYISEPNLQTAIPRALDNWGEDITAGELAGITALYARPKFVSDSYCYVEMDSSDCYDVSPSQGKVVGQRITDISILANLTNLTTLNLSSNQISDITPLANLTNLTTLHLTSNQIRDLSPLVNLTNLTTLYLTGNQITDISPLTNLTNLTALRVNGKVVIVLKQRINVDTNSE